MACLSQVLPKGVIVSAYGSIYTIPNGARLPIQLDSALCFRDFLGIGITLLSTSWLPFYPSLKRRSLPSLMLQKLQRAQEFCLSALNLYGPDCLSRWKLQSETLSVISGAWLAAGELLDMYRTLTNWLYLWDSLATSLITNGQLSHYDCVGMTPMFLRGRKADQINAGRNSIKWASWNIHRITENR